jgi:hypothetical protein
MTHIECGLSSRWNLLFATRVSAVAAAFVAVAVMVTHTTAGAQCACPGVCNPAQCNPEDFCDVNDPIDWCTYPITGCRTGSQAVNGGCCSRVNTPILLDLDGDGFELTDELMGVPFAIGPTDVLFHVAWTAHGSDDAWLVLDRNGNGRIDNGVELFGNYTPQPEPPPGHMRQGFRALAELDRRVNGGNRDGRFTRADAMFSKLRLWRDVNHDGVSQPNELLRLGASGVEGIDLDYRDSRRVDEYGNRFRFRARVLGAGPSGVGRWAFDILLQVANMGSPTEP